MYAGNDGCWYRFCVRHRLSSRFWSGCHGGFFRHVAQHFLQYAGHPEFPLHQIADDHHQILAESLEHKQISFDIVYVLTVLFDGVVYFLKERICQSIDISQHFAAACLFGYT